MTTRRKVVLEDVSHVHICGDKEHYCAHPRHCGLWNFEGGELALIHTHARWDYKKAYPEHGWTKHGYKWGSEILLQRSTDSGETWPKENDVVIFDETAPAEERRAFLEQDSSKRDMIDLSKPDSIFVFIRTFLGDKAEDGRQQIETFALRSPDRGRTWEGVPTRLRGPGGRPCRTLIGFSSIPMPDNTWVMACTSHPDNAMWVYGTDDDGLTWEYLSEVARSSTGRGGISYPGLIRLPDGRVQAYMLDVVTDKHTLCMSESTDLYAWTPRRPIVRWGHSPWREHLKPGEHSREDWFPGGVFYRSPWPLLLKDGRIVVLFARRKPPGGIGGVLSEDEGKTWSDEFIIRCDASGPDLGYEMAVQLDDGRIFAAYYYMVDDGNLHGGSRHIAGSFFSV
jgi:hypothetical protein